MSLVSIHKTDSEITLRNDDNTNMFKKKDKKVNTLKIGFKLYRR